MNQALHSISVQLQEQRDNERLAQLPDELGLREHIRNRPFSAMVTDLAKPGQDIIDTLTPLKFCALAKALGYVIGTSESLDQVKKLVIYNKAIKGVELQGEIPLDDLTPEKAHLLHMAVGSAGEAGELADAIADHVYQGAELDVENVLEEIGDQLFYLQGILNAIGYSLHDAMLANKVKLLGKRYKNGYSDAAAQARADKPAGE